DFYLSSRYFVPMKKKRRQAGSDQAYVVDEKGNKSNGFLYELVDKPDSPEMIEQHREWFKRVGMTDDEIKTIS
ncbi:MAG: hypothetical protein ACRETW_00190, partial [Stenotrophobium sp.]